MRTAALTLRAVPRLALRLPRRFRRFVLLALIAATAITAAYYGWFRDSSLVRVREVQVTGLTGPEAARARELLKSAGLDMSTLHVREDDLRRAVESEPSILSLTATPDFPHTLRIDVTENHPVAAIVVSGSGKVPIAGNGMLMPGDTPSGSVPEIRVRGVAQTGRRGTAAARLTDERVAPLLRIAATAPPVLLKRSLTIERRKGEGIVVVMKSGPRVMFGDDTRAADKWRAAAGVLASPNSQGAAYIDVRLPNRPVAGGLKAQTPAGGVALPQSAPTPAPAPATPSTPAGGSAAPATPVQPVAPATTAPQAASPPTQTTPANPQP